MGLGSGIRDPEKNQVSKPNSTYTVDYALTTKLALE